MIEHCVCGGVISLNDDSTWERKKHKEFVERHAACVKARVDAANEQRPIFNSHEFRGYPIASARWSAPTPSPSTGKEQGR